MCVATCNIVLHPSNYPRLIRKSEKSKYARPVLVFLRSDASGICAIVIHRMHVLRVKAHAESNQICNKRWLFFSQEKLIMGVLPLVFEPSKNRPCIVGWREYCLTWSPLSFVKSQSSTTYLSTSNLVTIRGLQFLVSCTAMLPNPCSTMSFSL